MLLTAGEFSRRLDFELYQRMPYESFAGFLLVPIGL